MLKNALVLSLSLSFFFIISVSPFFRGELAGEQIIDSAQPLTAVICLQMRGVSRDAKKEAVRRWAEGAGRERLRERETKRTSMWRTTCVDIFFRPKKYSLRVVRAIQNGIELVMSHEFARTRGGEKRKNTFHTLLQPRSIWYSTSSPSCLRCVHKRQYIVRLWNPRACLLRPFDSQLFDVPKVYNPRRHTYPPIAQGRSRSRPLDTESTEICLVPSSDFIFFFVWFNETEREGEDYFIPIFTFNASLFRAPSYSTFWMSQQERDQRM